MSGLRIKHYAKSGIIRSVGDQPNGIISIDMPRGCFIVAPKKEPSGKAVTGQARVEIHSGDPIEDEGATPLTAEEVVEAAADARTAQMLWVAVVIATQTVLPLLPHYEVEPLEGMARLAREIRDQLAVNGYIKREEST